MIYSNPIKINENYSYTHDDIGLILYEAEMNSMRIFEATLQADFAQIAGLREGTLLESEVEAIKESNFADFKKKIVASLEAFWNKIKSMLNNFKNKLLETFESDGKPFITHFYKTINKNYKHKFYHTIDCTLFDLNAINKIIWHFSSIPVLEDSKNFDDYCKAWYTSFAKSPTCDDETKFISYIKSCSTYTYEISTDSFQKDIGVLISYIVNTKNEIKCINTFVKHTDTGINHIKRYLLKYTNDNDLINKYNISVNAFQKVMSTAQSTLIKTLRTCRHNCRDVLKLILSDVCNGEKDGSKLNLYPPENLSFMFDDDFEETCEACEEE